MTLAAQLFANYGWKTTAAFDDQQVSIILQAAGELRAFAEEMTGGRSEVWMHRWLSGIHFHLGGAPQRTVSWLGRRENSLVFPHQDVWLSPRFPGLSNPRQHVIHELAHVLDNRLARRALPATFFGGGPADRLVLEMGGRPRGLRFSNGTCGIPPVNQWSAADGYGNRATAEYFAEAFAWSLYYPPHLPSPVIGYWLKLNVFNID